MGRTNEIVRMGGAPQPRDFHINMLGSVVVRRLSDELDLGEPRQQAVLCVLALNAGQVVTKDRLIDGVWGEIRPRPPGRASTPMCPG